jgi:hypothetical protein
MYCLGTAAVLFGDSYDPLAVYLTWQRSPESTMTIRWITPQDRKQDIVEYRAEDDEDWIVSEGEHSQMPTEAPYLIHSIELTNLLPATNYVFRTGNDAVIYKFQTMPAELSDTINFVVGGDMYHDDIEILHETNRQAAKTAPLFVLVGGDIAYAADKKIGLLPRWTHAWIDLMVGQKPDRWLEWLKAWKKDMITPDGRLIPMLPVLGNHDTSGRFDQTPKEAPFFYALFAMPGSQGYNVLDFGNYMSIILLDSGHTHTIDGKQTAWLRSVLTERQQVPHTFAVYHVPAFPSVRKFNDEYCSQVRKNWTPLFDEFRLTAAFEHHDHCYKRTFPIKNGQYDRRGVVYFGDGAWGVEKPRKPRRLSQKWYLAHVAPERHFISIALRGDQRWATAINSQGKIVDEFEW